MPDLSVTTGMLPPLWIATALLVLLLVICVVAMRRFGSLASVAALFAVPALVVIAWSAWNFADHSIVRQRLEEREALNARALQLTAAALTPGSALACLDPGGETVEASCEAAVFGKPESVAAATAYVEAKLRLLSDSLDYSRRTDRAYGRTLTQLRRGLDADRYGFVAYVLATRDGCTAGACDAFSLLLDASAVKANIAAQTLENNIARYAANWPAHKGVAPVASAPIPGMPSVASVPPLGLPPAAALSSMPVTNPIDFPTAASIPAVSIMTEAPAPPPPKQAPGTPAPKSAPAPARPQ